METKSVFLPSLVAGTIVAAVLVIFNLTLFLLGIDVESSAQYIYYVLFALGLAWAVYSVRNNTLDGYATYGKALVIGVYASLAIAVIMAVYTYVYMEYINPGMIQEMLSKAEDSMIEANPNMSDEDLNKALEMTRMIMKPALMAPVTIISTALTGTLFSLAIAFFAKNEDRVVEV